MSAVVCLLLFWSAQTPALHALGDTPASAGLIAASDEDDACGPKKPEPCGEKKNSLTPGQNFSLLPSASKDKAEPATQAPAAVKKVIAETLEWHGTLGPKTPGTRTARTTKEWRIGWTQIANQRPAAPDFSRFYAVFIFAGEQRGQRVKFLGAKENKNSLTVTWKLEPSNPPAPDTARPYLVRLMPKTSLPIRLRRE